MARLVRAKHSRGASVYTHTIFLLLVLDWLITLVRENRCYFYRKISFYERIVFFIDYWIAHWSVKIGVF